MFFLHRRTVLMNPRCREATSLSSAQTSSSDKVATGPLFVPGAAFASASTASASQQQSTVTILQVKDDHLDRAKVHDHGIH